MVNTVFARLVRALVLAVCAEGLLVPGGQGQIPPAPGPTNPAPTNAQSELGATNAVNPAAEECKQGGKTT
jgi:hypothetical protein